jgi:anti-anti-sigma factor
LESGNRRRKTVNEFELKRDGDKIGVVLDSNLTASVVPGLKSALQQALEEGVQDLEFDFGRTTVIDSSGIGLLIATFTTLVKSNGTVRVVLASEDIFRLLQSMRLEKRLCVSRR